MAEIIEFLSPDWIIEQIKENPKPLTPLGEFVYYRTYSRWQEKVGRREYWHETLKRTIEYSLSLEHAHMKDIDLKPDINRMKKEAKKLFLNLYNTKQLPSGRTLWLGNGNQTINKKYRMGNFNCSYLNIEKWEDFDDIFYLLMVGSGVGFGGKKEHIDKLAPIRTNTKLINEPYNEIPKEFRNEDERSYLEIKDNIAYIQVNDTKEAWINALSQYLKLLTDSEYEYVDTISINYDNIRPKGIKLKTFGGTSSGPQPMIDLFDVVDKVLKNKLDPSLQPIETNEKGYGKVRPIHVLDIGNMIANIVVSGGVRRSAEIFLFDADDYESMFAKYGINGLWTDEQLEQHQKVGRILEHYGIEKPEWFDKMKVGSGPSRQGVDHRRMSNNSIAFVDKPKEEFMDLVFEMMQLEGEPGFVNLGTAAKRVLATLGNDNPTQEEIHEKALELGLNPCVEIILHSRNVCNLTTVNIKAFVYEDENGINQLDLEGLKEAQRLSARMGLRMTLLDLELPEWNKTQQRDRLLGTSMTGWKDAIDMLGWDIGKENELKKIMGDTSREEAEAYSKALRVNAPMFVTAIKPEGTLSQVMGGVSSGLHWSHSPYYTRRIRMNSSDPLALAVKDLEGWNVYAEVGTNNKYSAEELAEEEQLNAASTWVTEFPVASGAKRTKDDISVDEQFDNYFSFQDLYTDMNTSNTITIKPGEWKQAQKRVWDGWEDFVGVSFLALDGGTYTLAPYEAFDEESFREMDEKMVLFDPEVLHKYEKSEQVFDVVDDGCISGVCPVR